MTNLSRTIFFLLLNASVAAYAQTTSATREWSSIRSIARGIQGVFTTPPANLVTTKFTSGALMGNGDIGVVAGSSSTAEQTFRFGKSDFWGTHWNAKHNAPEVSILSLGSLTLSSPTHTEDADNLYQVQQRILSADVLTTLRLGLAVVHLRSWTADNDNVFVIEASTNATTPVHLSLQMPGPAPSAHMVFPSAVGAVNGTLWATRENDLTKPTDYKARAAIAVRVLNAQLADITPGPTASGGTFILKSGSPVFIVTVFETDARIGLDGPSMDTLKSRALTHAVRIDNAKVATMRQAHLAWWKRFWSRSFVDLHDKVLMDYYYGALYALGSSSRPGKLAPSLWGDFITTDDSAWGGRYFMNYNEEAAFYGVFSSNHADLAEPYNNMVLAQMPWQHNRTAEAGYQGVSFQRTFSPFTTIATPPAPVPVASTKNWKNLPSDQKSNATFSLLPTIQYFEYTQDKEFLRTRLYPAMRQLDAFWRDFAVRDPSRQHWMFEHSSAHEGGDDTNPNLDIGFALRIEKELIETSELLHRDADMRPVWKSFMEQLALYPTGMVNGKHVFDIAATVSNPIKNQGLFEPGDQPINLEGTVFPGENLAIGDSAEQLQWARNSLAEMNSWGVTRGGNSNNGFCKIFPIAARIGWPADDLVSKFKAAILFHWRPSNLTDFQGGGGIETSGAIEAIDSMLLQHEDGVMRIFPDWPASMDASFHHLRAKGAFLVSSEQRDRRVTFVDIESEQASALKLQSPWGQRPILVDGHTKTPDVSGQINLNFSAGSSHHLQPK